MTGAIAAAFLFASSAIFGQRLSRMMGGIVANFWRLLLAVLCLAVLCALVFPEQFPADAGVFWWFFLSGVIGFGFGDVGLFLAYYRIGARLTMLLNLCLAPVFGALGEFLWMGQRVTAMELGCIAVIVTGIVLALKPDRNHPARVQPGAVVTGVLFAVVAGMGQGFGAVVSRFADGVAVEAGVHMHGIGGGLAQAFVRTLGGLLVAVICFGAYLWVSGRLRRVLPASGTSETGTSAATSAAQTRARRRFFPFWLAGAALCGPVVGVSCFQWALQTEKSAVVLAITATSPLLVTMLARALDKERTSPLALAGSMVSVGGVIAICLTRVQ